VELCLHSSACFTAWILIARMGKSHVSWGLGALPNRISCFVLSEMSSSKPFPPYLAHTVNKFSGCANFPSILKCDVDSRALEGAPLLTWVSKHTYLLQVGRTAHWPSSQPSCASKTGPRTVVEQITLETLFPPSSLPFPVIISVHQCPILIYSCITDAMRYSMVE
jgi:hypothetical protein